MTTDKCADAPFRKSSFSNVNNPVCVEVGTREGMIRVRDSKDRAGGELVFTRSEWEAFLRGVKAGEFDA